MRVSRLRLLVAIVASALLLVSCSGKAPHDRGDGGSRPFSTWASLGESTYPGARPPAPERSLERGDYPIAGVASHHLLAHEWIDAWFRALAVARSVDTFVILCPRHFGQTRGRVSMSTRPWATATGLVRVDKAMAKRIAGRMDSPFDDEAFLFEHGISTLVPFVAEHFPGARIVPVAVPGEPPLDGAYMRDLAEALLPEFRGSGARRAFLLVSSDFSHHGTEVEADSRDAISRRFVERPSVDSAFFAGCDNRPGMYVLGALADDAGARGRVLWRTSASRIAPAVVDPADVTSYFFSFAIARP